MTKQITVIGLDQPGVSLGLALAEFKQSLVRMGHDGDGNRMKQAEKLGAFDKTCAKITDAVRGADIVVLSLPVDVIRDGFSMIAAELKPGSVVMDMSVMNEGVTAWARQILPEGVQFETIRVRDIAGKTVLTAIKAANVLDLSALGAGFYWVDIIADQWRRTLPVVKK